MKNKNWIITSIVMLSILVVVLVVFLVGSLNSKFRFNWRFAGSNVSTELVVDTVFESIGGLDINSESADVYIKEATGDDVRLIIYGDKDYIKHSMVNDTLKVDVESKSCIGICFKNSVAKVEVYLPEGYTNNIEINNRYGNIAVGDFINSNINITSNAGDVDIRGGNSVRIVNDYGDIYVGKSDIVYIEASAGDINIDEVREANIDSDYGDIKIGNVLGYLNIDADCGDIDIKNVNLDKNSSIKNDFGDVYVGSTNQIYIDAKSNLGDVKVKNNYRDGLVELKIENSCGDVEVDN